MTNSEDLFSALFADNYRQLCLYAFKYLKDQSTAEDIVQDCFMKVWSRWQDIRPETAAAYLYTAVRHGALAELKRNNGATFKDIDIPDTSEHQYAVEVETFNNLHAAMSQLPPKCRSVFELLMRGKNNSDIARILKISESTIRSQKAKGIMLIKKRIQTLYSFFLAVF